MDEDIDIEEHDLLDNPAIKNIFPDISVLKKEMSEYYGAAANGDRVLDVLNSTEGMIIENETNHLKKASQYVVSYFDSKPDEYNFKNDALNRNKIILGSRPTYLTNLKTNCRKEMEKNISTIVKLDDIGPYLKRTGRFCEICQTLFPGMKCFQEHNIKHQNIQRHRTIPRKYLTDTSYPPQKTPQTKGGITKLKRAKHFLNKQYQKIIINKHAIPKMKTTSAHSKIVINSSSNNSIPNTSVTRSPMTSMKKDPKDNVFIYKCSYCSYYFKSITFYSKHLRIKHKDTDMITINKTLFSGQCRYCTRHFVNIRRYNIHLHQYHKKKINFTFKVNPKVVVPRLTNIFNLKSGNDNITQNIIEESNNENNAMDISSSFEDIKDSDDLNIDKDSLVLTSVLFNCKRCDIHFLTTECTKNHENHMELLINWKCSICKHIFKQRDEFLHRIQHSNFSGDFTVVKLDLAELDRVLYKCTKCAIHFNEDNYFPHYMICGINMAESVYCKWCDFLIDKYIAKYHYDDHCSKRLNPDDFTIISTDIVKFKNTENSAINSNEHNIDKKKGFPSDCITSSDVIKSTKNVIHVTDNRPVYKRKLRIGNSTPKVHNIYTRKEISKNDFYTPEDVYFKLSYCGTCKSFVNLRTLQTKRIHIESKCARLKTCVCEYCGLVFTYRAIFCHRMLHEQRKKIKLQDFTFFGFNSGKKILPPIPQYPKCRDCDIHFISYADIKNHSCNDYDYLTCHICNTKYAESSFKPHMSFHYYSRTHNKTIKPTILYESNEFYDKRKNALLTTPKKMEGHEITSLNSEHNIPDINITITDSFDNQSQMHTNITNNKHNPSSAGNKEINTDLNIANKENTEESIKTKESQLVICISNSVHKTDYELYDVLYCCTNCQTTLDTYDKVVEHCQDHLCGVQIENKYCRTCKMTFEKKTYNDHVKFHVQYPFVKILLKFDIFYFTLDNIVWMKHIFGSINNEITQLILNRSIYRNNKIKMKIIQDGKQDLTVYKCDSCCVIIEADAVEKHSELSCFKVRKHPCSICGLPFSSYIAKHNHKMTIHTFGSNVTQKSYRIVLFNKEMDKLNNKKLTKQNTYFYLYQCRICNGVIDKYQRPNHKCDKGYLKKCEICDLMINGLDLNAHKNKHVDVPNFIQKNMKVILFGQTNSRTLNAIKYYEDLVNFDGTYIDYTLYQCVECKVCFDKSQVTIQDHKICCTDTSKYQCSKCHLFIPTKKTAQHTKCHENLVDFVRENMNIIPYCFSQMQVKFMPANINVSQINIQKDNKYESNKITISHELDNVADELKDSNILPEQTLLLFKCTCGLHFLDNSSIQEHFDHCNPSIAKQNCCKCNLLFTTSVLFDHLLAHHGNKKNSYTFNIIEMSKNFIKNNRRLITFEEVPDKNGEDFKQNNNKNQYTRTNETAFAENLNEVFFDNTNEQLLIKNTTGMVVHQDVKNHEMVQDIIAKDLITDKRMENHEVVKISEKATKLLKCVCGLHFLDESSIQDHFNHCNPSIHKQNCLKCNLLFTPSVLLEHLLAHHGNGKNNYEFNIIEISKNNNKKSESYQDHNRGRLIQNNTKNMLAHLVTNENKINRNSNEKDLVINTNRKPLLHVTDENEIIRNVKANDLIQNTIEDEVNSNNGCSNTNDLGISEMTAKLLKCVCGLHFLDYSSILDHFQSCNPRLIKQCCSKCNLLFTPDVLYHHMLIHHDAKYEYNYNIIEMSTNKCRIVILYKCDNCNTHFLQHKNAKAHYEFCHSINTVFREKCDKCNLFFNNCSIKKHQSEHHASSVADMFVVNVKKYLSVRVYKYRELNKQFF